MATQGNIQKTIVVGDRRFVVDLITFENGKFISISEGSKKIGSLVVSIGSGPVPTTATVIPAKTDSLFLKLTAEKISSHVRGISIVSLFTSKELGNEAAKTLLTNIMELVRN
jgi:hypothetical protein